ncbi:FtsX-like permease family protein [Fulvivirga sp. M361]|uniref:ABC transporter permease n=1 Tax=Fulvivirga sp. M361 TaxID=2594266 RepID=UPI00117B3339|nr:ABC transporter permease [Fulvivirga sp. M361]TRX48915.1 FtsX-like permease family protein [Fulvivirga sp. M361]
MFKHNILVAYRNFRRFSNSFLINLVGLSTGLTCAIFIFLWVDDELKMDKFYEKDDRLYRVMEHQQYAGEIMTTNSTPGILAETLKEEFTEVEYAATTTWVDPVTLSIDDHNVRAEGFHVGPDFFNIFSFELLQGSADKVLMDKTGIVISEELALKLFNTTEDVLGRQLEYQHEKTFQVTGIFKGTPKHSSIQFDYALSFEEYKDDNDWVLEWGNNGPRTYIVLSEGSNGKEFSLKIADFVKKYHEESHVTLFLKPYSDAYLYGRYENGKEVGGRIEYVRLFGAIAIFILIIACINFMNLSTAQASRRAKEVGIKKSVGAHQGELIFQYLSESLLISFISLLVALLLVWLILPQFNIITEKQIQLDLTNLRLTLSLIGITTVAGLLAGSYPALYLARFRPAKVLKGEVRGSVGELWARRGLVIFQFTLSVILIVAVIVIFKQIQFVQDKNMGYDNDNVIFFASEGRVEKNLETFLNEMEQIPGVLRACGIAHNLTGRQNNTSGLDWEGKNPDDLILFEHVRVSPGFLETLSMEIKEGRSFSDDFKADSSKIILNETAIKIMGFEEDPVGRTVKLWGEYDYEIVGVVKDFHFESLHDEVKPLFFRLRPNQTWNIMARIEGGQEKQTLDRLKDFYEEYNAGFSFEYRFLDEDFQKLYAAEQRVSVLSQYFAGFAIIISCLGLFGLAAFTAERRLKEIGIRKALGSTSWGIIYLMSSDFTKMVLISIILALPISYYLIDIWLQRFAFRIELELWFFILSGVIALIIAWLTVGSQAVKAASINPARCLKDE